MYDATPAVASYYPPLRGDRRSKPAVGEYGDGGPGLPHHVKIKVGQQQAGLRAQ